MSELWEKMEASDNGYDRRAALKAFDDSIAGVKGLVDIGITRVLGIFIFDKSELEDPARDYSPHKARTDVGVPMIDMETINQGKAERDEIVGKIRDACESSGFFQVVNHGIPVRVLDGMIDGARRFHEQDVEVKKRVFSRDMGKRFFYNSNHDMYSSKAANWRDIMYGLYAPERWGKNLRPIKELLSKDNPPIYRGGTTIKDFMTRYYAEELGTSSREHLEL